MPDYTISLTGEQAARLQEIVTEYNHQAKTLLDVAAFLQQHVQEIAIQRDLQDAHNALLKQAEADVAAGVAAVKTRLLQGDKPKPKG